ncbi:hypothetical protein ACFW9L_00725 [Streptomyces sp. NPDC059517]|uniref:hypothetical protein n=1 Tax=Streptomyces sp. NPDC059517 TaxID=3346855 RepID=UPI0036BB4969
MAHDPLASEQVRRTVRSRDGRTSTETLRGSGGGGAGEYPVLGRARRLQLTRDHVERHGPRGRVRLTAEPGRVGVWPDRARRGTRHSPDPDPDSSV